MPIPNAAGTYNIHTAAWYRGHKHFTYVAAFSAVEESNAKLNGLFWFMWSEWLG
jgi:hypothetical protein